MSNFNKYLREAINNVCLPCMREQYSARPRNPGLLPDGTPYEGPCHAVKHGGMVGCWMRCTQNDAGGMDCVACKQGTPDCNFHQTVDDFLKPRHPQQKQPYYDLPKPQYGGPEGWDWIEGPGNSNFIY